MKKLKYILCFQLILCIILTLFSFLKASAVAHKVPKIHAYERILKKENKEFSRDKKNEIIGLTPVAFAEHSLVVAKDAISSTGLLVVFLFTATVFSSIELLYVSRLIKKESIEPEDSGNGVPPSQI